MFQVLRSWSECATPVGQQSAFPTSLRRVSASWSTSSLLKKSSFGLTLLAAGYCIIIDVNGVASRRPDHDHESVEAESCGWRRSNCPRLPSRCIING